EQERGRRPRPCAASRFRSVGPHPEGRCDGPGRYRLNWRFAGVVGGVSAMSTFFLRTVVLAVALSASSVCSAATLSEQSELLCSPEGLMRLIPQFNVKGQFTIPDPNADLQTFLSAQQGLSNAVEMILAQENRSQDPSEVGRRPSRPLIFG